MINSEKTPTLLFGASQILKLEMEEPQGETIGGELPGDQPLTVSLQCNFDAAALAAICAALKRLDRRRKYGDMRKSQRTTKRRIRFSTNRWIRHCGYRNKAEFMRHLFERTYANFVAAVKDAERQLGYAAEL